MEYIKELDKKYEIDPRPPLVEQPRVCARLSVAALQRNLAAHRAKNPQILLSGGKAEMAERLRSILEMRRMDMLVRDLVLGVWGEFEEEEDEDEKEKIIGN
ncbi:hypothetical protein C0992_006959 [Termitomyces sp. T32_za158]|nr:hypothetical protein C0992_006959 [Termitomyces sp. T32_za158]